MDDPLTIVLLGHTGVGKSATGNTILGRKAFESRRSFKPLTKKISEESATVFGRLISVVDTPGIICPNSEEIKSYFKEVRSPCLFLVVLKIDRFTEEQERAVAAAVKVIGEQRLHLAYMLFTHGDALDRTLEEFIHEDSDSPLPALARQFKSCVSFNNQDGGPQQVRELLEATGHMAAEAAVSGKVEFRRVVLLGLCGAGKSSSGNTMLGQERFTAASGFDSVTTACVCGSRMVENRWLEVMDTPGLTDPKMSPKDVATNIVQALRRTGPVIHAFVIVVKFDRVSEVDCNLLLALPHFLGEEAARYTIVLFTHGDKLNGQPMSDHILSSRFASELVAMCGGRYCVFNNNQKGNRQQVRDFLHKVDEMVACSSGEPCRIIRLSKDSDQFGKRSMPDFSQSVPQEPEHWYDRIIQFFMRIIEWLRSLWSQLSRSRQYKRLAAYS